MRTRCHNALVIGSVLLLGTWSGWASAQELTPGEEGSHPESQYAGQTQGPHGFLLEFQSLATRDDNIFIDNTRREGDFLLQQGALLKLWDNTPRWNLNLEYHPTGLLYTSATDLDSFNQELTFDGSVRARPHLTLRWSDTFTRTTGLAQPVSNGNVLLSVGPGPQLATTLLAPLANELGNGSVLEAIYQLSPRSSVDFSGGYEFFDFDAVQPGAGALFSQRSANGGMRYDYRLTRHLTVGGRYLFQRFHFRGGSQDDTQSAYLTTSWQFSPHVVLELFGGAQYSNTDGLFLIPAPPGSTNTFLAVSSTQWDPAGGATLTWRTDRTVLRLTGQRLVSNDGGLLSSVLTTYGGAELRRRLIGGWDLVVTGSDSRSVALQGPFGIGVVDMQSAGVALERPLLGPLTLHAEYGYFRERTNQSVSFTANVDRDRYTFGLFYTLTRPTRSF